MRAATMAFVAFLAAGCSMASLTPEGRRVLYARTLTDVRGCERMEPITVQMSSIYVTQATLGAMSQDRQDRLEPDDPNLLADNLIQARNEAARRGATHVIEAAPPYGGVQDFELFRCPIP
jgi:hypothetical protein